MMHKFKKKKAGGTPKISTASLPDIVFMLLFFFMVTTVMRETSLKVRVQRPAATEIQKLEKKSLVSYIYIGPPIKMLATLYGTEPRIQLDDAFATVDNIAEFVEKERKARNEAEVPYMTMSLKVDKDVKMGIVSDVKQELRRVNALKINYSTRKGDEVTGK
jgi:biopolymer transport protein ExbD